MENKAYIEDSPILPRMLTYTMVGVFAATFICMLLTSEDVPMWIIGATAVVFVIVAILAYVARLRVRVDQDGVEVVHMFRTTTYPRDMILDKRLGELADIRNYSNWDLKGVKRRTYTRVGDDCGVALKIKGKTVVVISSADHEALFAHVPTEIREEDPQDA